uniref:Uncharacterized protein isoform X2 n=1 Tax=Nicotiana tabacum TaxID=4097 RepID=A0A1S3ZMD7_TOBAC|nr:PREDICTED: uncharacterized protein LOC107788374 isoform X2 [Nicotiana tabacum]
MKRHACKLCIRQLLAIIRLPEVEGTKLQQKIEPKINDDEGYPIIHRRIIGIYNGLLLQAIFNSTIQIDPRLSISVGVDQLSKFKQRHACKLCIRQFLTVIRPSHDDSCSTTNYPHWKNSVTNFVASEGKKRF